MASTRMTSPLAGIGWLRNALNVGSRQPGTLLGAAALILVVAMLPSLVTLPVQLLMPGNGKALLLAFAGAMVLGLLLSPVMAGFLQVIDAIERGRPVRAFDVFAPYGRGEAGRIIGFALLLFAVYAVCVAILALAAGPELRAFYAQALTTPLAQPAITADAIEAVMPRLLGVATLLGVVVSGMFAIGYAQIAIAGRPVGASFADAVAGSLKNLLSMLIALVLLTLFWLVVAIVLVILVLIVGLFAKFVGQWLMFVAIVPLYLGLMLGMYVVLFGMAYWFWRDVCGVDAAAPAVAEA